jgi:ABC-2 type transport system permease protein
MNTDFHGMKNFRANLCQSVAKKEFMMTTQTIPRFNSVSPILYFARTQLLAMLRNVKTLLIGILTPVFMLSIFWFTARGSDDAGVLAMMFPVIVCFGVMLGGSNTAVRAVNWRQQNVFQRLAVTPVPVGQLMLGDAAAQTLTSLLQGIVTLLFGTLVLGYTIDAAGLLLTLLVLLLAGACFIAFGLVIASFVNRAEVANPIYIFTLMPLFFLGGGLPGIALPTVLQWIGQWSPVGVTNALVLPLLRDGQVPEGALVRILALVGYTAVFSLITSLKFRWE